MRLIVCVAALWLAAAPAANAQDQRLADWLRTVRDSALWSASADPAIQFTTLPPGSFLQPRAGSESGRLLVYFPGDGATRQAGMAWIAAADVAPSGPPPWIVTSELDGDQTAARASDALPRRAVP